VLERVALHQTRFRIPGITPDARGVVLGTRGLVLFASLDRLATFLAAYSAGHGLATLAPTFRIHVLRSPLNVSEIALSFDAHSSDRMDSIADAAKLAGGLLFTGTARHFVEYRSAAAPFGWDAADLAAEPAALVLYHSTFEQPYAVEREVDVRRFVLRLEPRPDPAPRRGPARLLLAEPGVGPALLRTLVRSSVDARVAVLDFPMSSDVAPEPDRKWLFEVPELPERMRLFRSSLPGITSFVPIAPRAAVEEGFSHPLTLESFPFFGADAPLVLFWGRRTPLEIAPGFSFTDVRALVRITVGNERPRTATPAPVPEPLRATLRLVSSGRANGRPTAAFIPTSELSLLRQLAYVLDRTTLTTTRIFFASDGAYLVAERPLTSIPLGRWFEGCAPSIFVPFGMDLVPRVSPGMLANALGAEANSVTFFFPEGRVVSLDRARTVTLDAALVEGVSWASVPGRDFDVEVPLWPSVRLEPLGLRPLSRAREKASS
jgi:hypothetical protein